MQVPDDIFVDASTGRCYPIARSPFLGVESMWNDANYWVCMQMPEPHSDSRAAPKELSLDLTDSSKWEYLLPSATPQVTNRHSFVVMWTQCICMSQHQAAASITAWLVLVSNCGLVPAQLPYSLSCSMHHHHLLGLCRGLLRLDAFLGLASAATQV